MADIACGSGSFLLGAYQFLLDWYLAAYLTDGAQKWATGRNPRLYQTARGDWRLTISERKRILLDHIYGVDIDPQAVEVTKLSLLLKVLEDEDEQTLDQQLALFPERVPARPGQQHQVRQLADRAGLLRRATDGPAGRRSRAAGQRLRLAG